jgi:hypothetical protein
LFQRLGFSFDGLGIFFIVSRAVIKATYTRPGTRLPAGACKELRPVAINVPLAS